MVKYYTESDPKSAEQIRNESSLYWLILQRINSILF
jgi:hypothetical protein